MKIGLPFLLLLAVYSLHASDSLRHRIYLLPGQGSDKRIFNKINFDGFDTIHLACLVPEKMKNKKGLAHDDPYAGIGSRSGYSSCNCRRQQQIIYIFEVTSLKITQGMQRKIKYFLMQIFDF